MLDAANQEVFHARLLIMECTFLDDAMSPEEAKVSKVKTFGLKKTCNKGSGHLSSGELMNQIMLTVLYSYTYK